jgi:iron complex transport system substrate-binding protein
LSQIAPTVTPDSTALNVDWDQRLLSTAAAVDKTGEAEDIITKIKAEFAAAGASVPNISSKTYQWVRADPDGYGFGNGSVLELFGLKPAANQDNTQNGPPLSKENTAQLNADLLGIWVPTQQLRDALDKDPLFQSLPAVKNGTVFYADLAMADAANEPAPMALQWLKDKLLPVIEKLG